MRTCNAGLACRLEADDLDLFPRLDHPRLYTPRRHGAAAWDGEHVFDGHQKVLVEGALGVGDVAVYGIHELQDGVLAELGLLAIERAQR